MGSRARNFRRRLDDISSTEDEPKNATAAAPKSTRTTKPLKPSSKLLSFADDEEEDNSNSKAPSFSSRPNKPSSKTRLTKPSSSSTHKITTSKDRVANSTTSLSSNVQPQAGTYTKEALLELQKNTRTLARPSSKVQQKSGEPVIVLKGVVKPMGEEEKEGEGTGTGTESQLARMGIRAKEKEEEEEGVVVPDQAMIEAIRRKREKMRKSRAVAEDYIALDSGSNHGAAEGLSDEEPEFQGRIKMFGEKVESGRKGVFEDKVDVGVETVRDVVVEEEDEEEKIWEEEQFRKGLGKRVDDAGNRGVSSSAVPVVHKSQQPMAVKGYGLGSSVPVAPPSIGGLGSVGQGLDVVSIPQQAEIAKKALQENIMRLKESHGRTLSSLAKVDDNLSASLTNITNLEEALTAAGEKFIFMQKLRDFVSVLCDFLQHKAPFIEELEEQMQKLNEERASTILERRAADNGDEMKEVEAAISAAIRELSKGGSSAAVVAAAKSAAQAASSAIQEQTNIPVKLDEFGRDMNLQKSMDMKRRAEARQRRKARSEAKRKSSMEVDGFSQKIEGESSTDESDGERTAYQSNRDLLLQTADQIFSDASEEYSQLPVVKERLERWKKQYAPSYRDAYMSLSALAIFSPYVRLELLKWDPLHEDTDFFDMKWHSLLFNYGLPSDGSDFAPGDADADLIPGLVEKVALPILHHEILHCWDMLSTQETKKAVSATNMVVNYVPAASSEALAELLAAIRTRLTDAVANIVVPAWSPMVLQAVPNASRVAAYRFGTSVRLLRNICLWKDILALPILEKLALDELLSRKVIPHVESIKPNIHDAVTRAERVISSLSGLWAGPSVTGDHSHRLQPLVGLIMSLGESLKKKHSSGVAETETSGLARRLKKMLVELNDYDSARAITRTFNLREAL